MKKGLVGVLCFALSICCFAQPKAYPIDSWHSKVGFSVKFGGLIDVEGRFTGFGGTIVYDEQRPARLSATVFIDPASIDTGVRPRDRHLKSDDFFGVAQYSRITFSSKRTIQHGSQFQLIGDLTMHGITREVTIPFTVIHEEQEDPWKNFRISFQGTLQLNRIDYGIGEKDEIGDEVTIDLIISARIMNMETIALFSRPFGNEMMEKFEKEGLKEARSHIAVLQSSEDPDVAKPGSFIRLSQKFFQNQMFDKAIQACLLGIEVFPDEASLHASLANIYFRMGKSGKAREASASALALDADNSLALEIMKWVEKD